MKREHLLPLLAVLCMQAATAQTQDLRSCRGLSDAAVRLACYDALPLPPQLPEATATPAAPRAAPAGPLAAAAGPAVPTPPGAAPGVLAAGAGEAAFGLQEPARGELAAMRSSVSGRFEGWGPRSRIRLANGQVWEVTDGSRVAVWLLDPKVVVRRAALGSFLMEVEGLKQAARVQRVQ